MRLRSNTHRRRSVEGREKSMTARRSAGSEPLLIAHCMAARAWRRTFLFRVGAAFARLCSSDGALAVLAISGVEKAATAAASQSERISLVMEKVSSVCMARRNDAGQPTLPAVVTVCRSVTPCRRFCRPAYDPARTNGVLPCRCPESRAF
ncbi:hypothetical protein OF001_U20209 [Pseudomonas sp. OF001]|nr:hypothetical protein OF001_U20209 [Pseudomonas sp. OF001]